MQVFLHQGVFPNQNRGIGISNITRKYCFYWNSCYSSVANLEPQEPDKKCHVNVTITVKVALSHIFHCMFPKKNFSGRLYLLIQWTKFYLFHCLLPTNFVFTYLFIVTYYISFYSKFRDFYCDKMHKFSVTILRFYNNIFDFELTCRLLSIFVISNEVYSQ